MVKKNYPRNLSQWESEMDTDNKITVLEDALIYEVYEVKIGID